MIPESTNFSSKLNILTSAGYEDKSRFVDNFFSNIAEIVLWRAFINNLINVNNVTKYVYLKIYFTLIAYQYSINR